MNRPFHRQEKRRGRRSAAALEDVQAKRRARRLEREAQGRRRGRLKRLRRGKERDKGVAAFGRHGETAQFLIARGRQPGEKRLASRAQHLLRGPQGIATARGAPQRELRKIDPGGRQRRRIRKMRRRKPHDALTRPGERCERRNEKLELADARTLHEELGEHADRPAAAGKLAIERFKPGRKRRRAGRKRPPAPHRMPLEDLIQRRRHDCIYIQYQPSWQACKNYRMKSHWLAALLASPALALAQ